MTDALAHRGPDDAGYWVDAPSGVALGHRRLSILDLSAAGHQPMISADGRFVISFNGEIYNYRDLAHDLEARGHAFRGHSDTEVLLAAAEAWGVERTLERCNGMLAFALWDNAEHTLTLARDRLGKKPLYYGRLNDGSVVFASELKALFTHPSFAREVDAGAVDLFLRLGWLPAPYTIFKGINKLPPASLVTIRACRTDEDARPRTYWSARTAAEIGARDPFSGTLEEATDALQDLLADAVRIRMIADVSLGALLSGGIDSSAVVASMQASSARPVKTFSIGFREAKYDESPYAAAVARHLGTEHTELFVTAADGLDVIPKLPEIYDEPFADASQIPTFLVSRLARQHVTVALSGDGGDETFAGYEVYRRCLAEWSRLRRVPTGVRRNVADLAGRLAYGAWFADPIEASGRPHAGRRQRLAAKLAKRTALLAAASPVGALAGKRMRDGRLGPLVNGAGHGPTVLDDPHRWAAVADPLQQMQAVDIESYLTDDVLVKVDRASMAVALEVRSPLLDWRIVEFGLRLPAGMRTDGRRGKLVLRNLLARSLPNDLVERRKAGFSVPVTEWLRGPLRDWAEALLDPSHLPRDDLLNGPLIRRLWVQHLAGSHDHERVLWSLLMFQAWRHHWSSATAAASSGAVA